MKRLLFLALIFLPVVAQSQEVYQVSANAGQVTRLTKAVAIQNRLVCSALGLPATCTQVQACTSAGAPGGASCTAAQARGQNVRVYPATLAGREEFVTFGLVVPAFIQLVNQATTADQQDFCGAFKAASQATRDATCTTYGLPAACEPCS